MNVLKRHGTYLQKEAAANSDIASTASIFAVILFLIALGISLIAIIVGILLNFKLDSSCYPCCAILYLPLGILAIGNFFQKRSTRYSDGLAAEKLVSEYLHELDDSYYLIDDIKLLGGYGNIDHIVLGPNGVFVIETKNYTGDIRCKGDDWIRYYGGSLIPEREMKSPSRQVKRNAVKIKQLIDSAKIFKPPISLWVDGIVVFTNPKAELELSDATVSILRLHGLCGYIKGKRSGINLSLQEINLIATAILKHADAT